uniref:Secreted protein n=1 Tax=Ixodes ricinus TaxID=34613 RepID=A0A6B0UPE5_IXORI
MTLVIFTFFSTVAGSGFEVVGHDCAAAGGGRFLGRGSTSLRKSAHRRSAFSFSARVSSLRSSAARSSGGPASQAPASSFVPPLRFPAALPFLPFLLVAASASLSASLSRSVRSPSLSSPEGT